MAKRSMEKRSGGRSNAAKAKGHSAGMSAKSAGRSTTRSAAARGSSKTSSERAQGRAGKTTPRRSAGEHPGRTAEKATKSARAREKVGSSVESTQKYGSKLDLGVPASRARGPIKSGGRGKGPEQGTGTRRAVGEGRRTSGVGYPLGSDGTGSGGDLDTEIIGVGSGAGIAAGPPGHTEGPDVTTQGGSEPFASGPPAKGRNTAPRGNVGGSKRIKGDSHDHSGGDASTTGPESGADQSLRPTAYPAPAADGDVTDDEAARRRTGP